MVFALLIAAIIWNLGTWWLGLPASSSHTLIGSIIGVGIANALMRGQDGTSGVDWARDRNRLVAAALAAVRLHHGGGAAAGAQFVVRNSGSVSGARGNKAPPLWIRGILIAPAPAFPSRTARTTARRLA